LLQVLQDMPIVVLDLKRMQIEQGGGNRGLG
jgi:hypothetical protein